MTLVQVGADAVASQPGSIVDLALALGLLLSMLVGVWRGLLKEMLSLMGWAASYMAAQWWGPLAGAWVPVGVPGSRLNELAGMMVIFIAAWLAWAVLSWAAREMVKASGLGGTDRLLGAVFGVIRGLLVALVVYTLVGMTPVAQWAPWQASRALPWLRIVLEGVRPLLPETVVKVLPPAA